MSSSVDGLSSAEVQSRLSRDNGSVIEPHGLSDGRLLLRQLNNPIVLLLIGATVLSMLLGDTIDGSIILAITGASVILGFHQERGAVHVVADLLAAVQVQTEVLRDGRKIDVPLGGVVVGDVLILHAGSVVAGDARVLESDGLLVDESALTGESFPAAKRAGAVSASTARGDRDNALWSGTHVVSGSGRAMIAAVGSQTEFGRVAAHLMGAHVPTAFELGLRRFGFLIMRAAGVLVVFILGVNIALGRPILESVLFSLALAVGLTPQLLPAIVTVTLAHGAREMARQKVIVKRLDAIEDIGAIDVLCTDKTGTMTSGVVSLAQSLDTKGESSSAVMALAVINATLQQGFPNPIDDAIVAANATPMPAVELVDELPYDFSRKLLSVLVVTADEASATLITKGAVDSLILRCRLAGGEEAALRQRFESLSMAGYRVLGLGTRVFSETWPTTLQVDDEAGLEFRGFLCFADPPKADAASAVAELRALGVTTKLITGDNRYAASHAANAVGIDSSTLVVGAELVGLDETAMQERVSRAAVFAEIEPLQKEDIVKALRRAGHVVGFLGDGINDAPSLRVADVGISVDSAVDIAKHSASVVLLTKDLAVLAEGIRQGRRVFANTLKYVKVTLSANFGNMVSMAAAAVLLPFLPLLPRQILLLNFLSDIPGTLIATDNVDEDQIKDPHGWDIAQVKRFMLVLGIVSSLFDVTTFVIMRAGLHYDATRFRTGWFIESTATELAAMLVLRTARPFYRSRPGTALLLSSAVIGVVTVALPFSPLRDWLDLSRPSLALLFALAGITAGYVAATQWAKRFVRPERRN